MAEQIWTAGYDLYQEYYTSVQFVNATFFFETLN